MSYSEALSLANRGIFTETVLQTMRNEIRGSENAGPASRIHFFDTKINLGVALMQMGNQRPDALDLYDQSEQLFMSVLKEHPEYEAASKNLEAVRRNKKLRFPDQVNNNTKFDSDPTSTVIRNGAGRGRPQIELIKTLPITTPVHGEDLPSCRHTEKAERWLTIGIPTVPRRGNPQYLTKTLNAILKQLPTRRNDPLYHSIIVVVLNNQPKIHAEFDEVRQRIENSPYRHYFRFEEAELAEVEDAVATNSAWVHEPLKVLHWKLFSFCLKVCLPVSGCRLLSALR